VCRKGEEEHTHRHTLKAHVEEEWTRARSTYAEKDGGKENQGEKDCWEGDRRERKNGEKQSGGERREDDMRERGGTSMGE